MRKKAIPMPYLGDNCTEDNRDIPPNLMNLSGPDLNDFMK
jgi:hypothetical protein